MSEEMAHVMHMCQQECNAFVQLQHQSAQQRQNYMSDVERTKAEFEKAECMFGQMQERDRRYQIELQEVHASLANKRLSDAEFEACKTKR